MNNAFLGLVNETVPTRGRVPMNEPDQKTDNGGWRLVQAKQLLFGISGDKNPKTFFIAIIWG